MKTVIIITLFTFSLASCDRCEICSYTNDKGETIETAESCGSKNARTDFENELKEQWADFGEVTCTNN